jgi:hypothetical protein
MGMANARRRGAAVGAGADLAVVCYLADRLLGTVMMNGDIVWGIRSHFSRPPLAMPRCRDGTLRHPTGERGKGQSRKEKGCYKMGIPPPPILLSPPSLCVRECE